MTTDTLTLYIDRLRADGSEEIEVTLSPEFLDTGERELRFASPVHAELEAYLADETLVIRLSAEAEALIPCKICNNETSVPIVLSDLYTTVSFEEIHGGLYHCLPLLRELILLEVPAFVECNEGLCPSREEIKQYLKKEGDRKAESQQPFKDL